MKKGLENTMLKDGINYQTRSSIDFEVGDFVQIRNTAHVGRIGKIIGVKPDMVKDRLIYTVQFSDKEAVTFFGGSLSFVKGMDETEHKSDN